MIYPLVNWAQIAQSAGVLDPAYEAQFHALHPGTDHNGQIILPGQRDNGDRDLGWKLTAVSDGQIVAAGFYPVFGNIALLAFTAPDGRRWWAQYAHARRLLVKPGQWVKAGEVIGGMGKGADNAFPSHLHFEIRRDPPSVVSPDCWPSAKFRDRASAVAFIQRHYVVDQAAWFKFYGAASVNVPLSLIQLQ
ncbi:hypothetical protein GCM10022631_30020 [Deinococcus rubellus]|uniref:M23 family metallopeptidase n=1 Tax=Deinococcus rubellus TaxID=1889240 RepID=UPI0031F18223